MSRSPVASAKSQKSPDLVAELRRRINSGLWKPGERLPSYSESRALFGAHSVAVEKAHAQLEREGLIVRERGRGTFVAPQVGGPQKVRHGLIGVAGLGFAFKGYSPYWVSLLRGIREVCEDADVQVLLLDYRSNKGWEKADGVLVCDWSNRLTLQWLPPAMPCVSMMWPTPGIVSVYADDYGATYSATQHLLQLGHRRIGFLHSPDPGISGLRRAGWQDALKSAGLAPTEDWERALKGPFHYEKSFVDRGREMMREWIAASWQQGAFSALLTQNDETAIGAIQALREAGMRVPEDVSVMGYDGVTGGEWASQGLATMVVPLEDIGRAAVGLLLRQLDGEDIGTAHRVFPIALREGATVGRVPSS